MFDHWFPAFSPSGRLAVGSQQVTTYSNPLFHNPQPIGPGFRPQWDGETLYYHRPDGVVVKDGQPVSETAFNEFSIANGFWAGHRTDPPRIIWKAGGETPGWWKPRLSGNGRFSALRHADGALCFSNLDFIVDTGVREHQLVGDLLVWVKDTEIYGRNGAMGFTVNLTIPGEKHFYAFPLLIGGQPWVLTHTDDRLLLYPWGSTEGYVLNSGISDNPTAWWDGESVWAVWSAKGEGFGHRRRITDPRVLLIPQVPQADIELPAPLTIRLKDFFVGGDIAWPRDGSHPLDQKWDGRNFWLIKFGSADHWERWVLDQGSWYMREDRSQSGAGDYSVHPGLIHTDNVLVGQWNNQPDAWLQRYEPTTGEIIDQHRFPYKTAVTRAWRRYDCGGAIGVLEHATLPMVIEFTYDPGNSTDTVERYHFARGYGLVKWSVQDQNANGGFHQTIFNERSNRPRLEPTTGHYQPFKQTTKPPVADLLSIVSTPVPPDIFLGAVQRFRNETLLDKDKVGDESMTMGALMYFCPNYFAEMIKQLAAHGVPGGSPEQVFAKWAGYSVAGLNRAAAHYDRDQKDGPIIPPAGDRPLGNIVGQAKVNQGWWDNTGLIKPTLCHLGDLFSVFVRNPGRALELLDLVRAAGYHGVRFWTTLGGDSGFWANRGVGPNETPNYWELLESLLRAIKDRGLVAHIAQGDLRASVVSDRASFARHLAQYITIVGADVCFLWEALNESRDTGEPSAARLAEFAHVFTAHCPWPLIALSAYTGHEDVAITNDFSRDPADIFTVHGYRDGRYWDKIRHIFSWAYESKPEKREGIQGEPFGPGPDVSASQHKEELTSDVMQAAAVMSLMTRQAWVYFSDPGVRTDHGSERLEEMPGFWETPKAVALLPQDITNFHQIFHGGETWRNQRVFAAQGEIRADHALHADGRFACLIYGPGSGQSRFHVPQTRGADISIDHYFGDAARLVIGQVH